MFNFYSNQSTRALYSDDFHLNDEVYTDPQERVKEKYDFFTSKSIPRGAYLTAPPQLGGKKLHIVGRTEGLCNCGEHDHVILKLEGGVICGWCDTAGQYVWGAN